MALISLCAAVVLLAVSQDRLAGLKLAYMRVAVFASRGTEKHRMNPAPVESPRRQCYT